MRVPIQILITAASARSALRTHACAAWAPLEAVFTYDVRKNLGFLDPPITVTLTQPNGTIVCFWANPSLPPQCKLHMWTVPCRFFLDTMSWAWEMSEEISMKSRVEKLSTSTHICEVRCWHECESKLSSKVSLFYWFCFQSQSGMDVLTVERADVQLWSAHRVTRVSCIHLPTSSRRWLGGRQEALEDTV